MKKTKKKPAARSKAPAGKSAKGVGIMPTGDRVLVRRAAPEEVTSFGIIIPDSTKEKSEEGTVVAVGPGRRGNDGRLIPVALGVGARVRFTYGEELKVGGVEYVLVHEDNVVAVLN